jgi:phenylacetate-CoA ligase
MRRILKHIEHMIPSGLRSMGDRIYRAIPIDVRYGQVFREESRFLDRSQWWSPEEHRAYQLRELKRLIGHAYEHVPFYRDRYNAHNIGPEDLRTLEDLARFPTVTKDDLRNELERMRSTSFPKSKFQYHTTGGSTAKPVGLYWESDRTVPLERAFMRRQWRWAGFEMEKDRSIVLRGIPIPGGKLFEEAAGNQLRISTYDLTESNIDELIGVIDDFKPKAIQAYPSAAFIVAQHIARRGGHRFPYLDVILCGSENIYPWQRMAIESAFGCRAYSWYGQSEYVSLAGECEYSTEYHFYAEYGITEFIRHDGSHAEPGETGEIVATGFNNFAMPLIRYRMEDLATLSTRTTCECGRHYIRANRIEGRLQEMIVSKLGNLVSMTAINMHNDVFDNVYQFQFQQDSPGVLRMVIARKPTYQPQDEARIRKELGAKLRDQFELIIDYVDQIPVTARGKVSFLVQKLPLGPLWGREASTYNK